MLDFLYNPNGRISRKGYLLAYLPAWLICTQLLPRALGGVPIASLVILLLGLFFLWPGIVAVPVKRLHDMGLSGWYHAGAMGLVFIAFIIASQGFTSAAMELGDDPLGAMNNMSEAEQAEWLKNAFIESPRAQLGFALMAVVMIAEFLFIALVPGQRRANAYGNDPLASGRGFAD